MLVPAIVIVAYGPLDHLRECLGTLGGVDTVVVVDNSSDPACRAVALAAGATYLDPGRNLGFAAGVNVGLGDIAPDRDVLLLNPDARLHPADLPLLQGALHAHPRTAAVAPRLVHADGSAQRTAWPLPSPAQVWRDALGLPRAAPWFLIGAVLLLRADALRDVGAFDERFFLYAEEADWQQRAINQGWEVREVRAVTAVHHSGGASTDVSARNHHFLRSGRAYAEKWSSGWRLTAWRVGSAVGALRRRAVPVSARRAAP